MKNKLILAFIIFSISFSKLTALDQNILISQIRDSFIREDTVEAYRWLTLLEEISPEKTVEARVLKSFVLGALGEENEGRNLLLNNLVLLKDKGFDENQINSIYTLFDLASEMSETDISITNCSGYQPKGLSIKYWLGAAALAVGIATAPFGNPAAPWLIGTGAGILLDTIPDLLENKEKHDQGLPPYDAETQKKIAEILKSNGN